MCDVFTEGQSPLARARQRADKAEAEVERLRTLYEERGEHQIRLVKERDDALAEARRLRYASLDLVITVLKEADDAD